jgi:hypothetical protein
MNQYALLTVKEDFLSQPFSNATITGSGAIVPGSVPWKNTWAHDEFRQVINTMTTDYQKQPENFTTLSVYEGLRRYETPFKWRPNLIAIVAEDSVSELLPDPNTVDSRNASLLQWYIFSPSGAWWNGLCNFNFQGFADGKCSNLREWTDEDTNAWRMGWKHYQIKRFLMNPNPDSEGSLSQQMCHLQCSPAILLGNYIVLCS